LTAPLQRPLSIGDKTPRPRPRHLESKPSKLASGRPTGTIQLGSTLRNKRTREDGAIIEPYPDEQPARAAQLRPHPMHQGKYPKLADVPPRTPKSTPKTPCHLHSQDIPQNQQPDIPPPSFKTILTSLTTHVARNQTKTNKQTSSWEPPGLPQRASQLTQQDLPQAQKSATLLRSPESTPKTPRRLHRAKYSQDQQHPPLRPPPRPAQQTSQPPQ